jgi:hypothetical protein
LPTEPLSISPADINGQKHVATPNAWARAIHGLQQRPEALLSPTDSKRQEDASPPLSQPPLHPADSQQRPAAPDTWARAVERLHQRQAALAQQAIGHRLAKAAKLATKVTGRVAQATSAKSTEDAKEFDRLWDGLALGPPVPALSSVPASGRTPEPHDMSGFLKRVFMRLS